MFASGRRKSSLNTTQHEEDDEEHNQLTTCLMNNQLGGAPINSSEPAGSREKKNGSLANQRNQKAKLARIESIGDEENELRKQPRCAFSMALNLLKRKRIFIPLIILLCMAAIYCVPYIEIQARVPRSLPHIPFNFQDGPLRASSVSQFRVEHLFRDHLSGPESVALDSQGNMYMATEGGFILYAHLNRSSPIKRRYYHLHLRNKTLWNTLENDPSLSAYKTVAQEIERLRPLNEYPELVLIAELNPVRPVPAGPKAPPTQQGGRARLADFQYGGDQAGFSRRQSRTAAPMRRECQLDEKVYGKELFSGPTINAPPAANQIDNDLSTSPEKIDSFTTHVRLSRCSKPLGVRLSQDEKYLYVVDTLAGLYKVHLEPLPVAVRLVDFRNNRHQLLPVVQLDLEAEDQQGLPPLVADKSLLRSQQLPTARGRAYLNVSLMAVDDLAVDYGAGSRKGDIIYMSLASQHWQAVSFVYDHLEGRPSAAVLRYDTGSNQLSVLNPAQVSLVRTSANLESTGLSSYGNLSQNPDLPYLGLGAPRLDENDVFDDRPLYFTNGLELTDDKLALLIVDTSNKRIIKHYIRGNRRGTSDHWAWTPNFPDNIRRGADKRHETYWVVGCGQGVDGKLDMFGLLREWPMLRKFLLKNFYLIGWVVEQFGAHLIDSTSVRDFGYSIKTGNEFCERGCSGMMILQYNKYGDIIRTIHSREFPHDTTYYSQVNEVIDAINQEHILYLSSPSYSYVTKLTLPTDSFDSPSPAPLIIDNVLY